MYKVGVIIKFESGVEQQQKFDFWGDAAAWIESLANDGKTLPMKVKMWIIRPKKGCEI